MRYRRTLSFEPGQPAVKLQSNNQLLDFGIEGIEPRVNGFVNDIHFVVESFVDNIDLVVEGGELYIDGGEFPIDCSKPCFHNLFDRIQPGDQCTEFRREKVLKTLPNILDHAHFISLTAICWHVNRQPILTGVSFP